MRVIYILWLRQLKRYWRSKPRIIGSLGQPLLFLVAFGFGFGAMYQKAAGGDYLNFLAPGIIGMSIIFTAVFSGIDMVWDRQFGFLKETFVAPVSRTLIVLGRTFGGATVAMLQGVVVMVLTFLLGFHPVSWWLILPAVMVMFVVALLFTALGTAIASLLTDMHGFQLIVNFLIMPLFFFSGALFPLNDLPVVLQWAVKINPLAYGVDAMRYFLTSSAHLSISFDLLVLSGVTVGFLGLATYLFSRIKM